MSTFWYALRSKPRKEETLWRQLRAQNIEVFYPQIRVQPVNPRARKVRPYSPGYMFVYTDLEAVGLSTFQWMPHAIGLVSYGGEPANVPENLINAIRRRVDEINEAGGELFAGLNLYLYGHKFKWQTGLQYADMEDRARDGGRYHGLGASTVLRIYW